MLNVLVSVWAWLSCGGAEPWGTCMLLSWELVLTERKLVLRTMGCGPQGRVLQGCTFPASLSQCCSILLENGEFPVQGVFGPQGHLPRALPCPGPGAVTTIPLIKGRLTQIAALCFFPCSVGQRRPALGWWVQVLLEQVWGCLVSVCVQGHMLPPGYPSQAEHWR